MIMSKTFKETFNSITEYEREKVQDAIRQYLELNNKFKNAYFFNPPSSAKERQRYEADNSMTYNKYGLEMFFEVDCSCKNVYVYKHIYIDGKKTNATALKKYLK